MKSVLSRLALLGLILPGFATPSYAALDCEREIAQASFFIDLVYDLKKEADADESVLGRLINGLNLLSDEEELLTHYLTPEIVANLDIEHLTRTADLLESFREFIREIASLRKSNLRVFDGVEVLNLVRSNPLRSYRFPDSETLYETLKLALPGLKDDRRIPQVFRQALAYYPNPLPRRASEAFISFLVELDEFFCDGNLIYDRSEQYLDPRF